MKLSVIIPVYNGANFIEKSYKSIINQGLSDFEIIYVDNNSKDNSVSIIKGLQEKNDNVKIFYQTQQGEAHSRNLGVKKALGDYIYQLDVDDEVFPGAINELVKVLDKNKQVDSVFGKMFKSNKPLQLIDKPEDESDLIKIEDQPYWGLLWFSDLSKVVGEAAFLHRRCVFEEIGNYNTNLKIGTDTDFDIRVGLNKTIAYIDKYIYLYYKHPNSLIEQEKTEKPRAFMQWPRLSKAHLQYSLTHSVPKQFKEKLYGKIYQSMAKQLVFTKGLSNRNALKLDLLNEVAALSCPRVIRYWLSFLTMFPYGWVQKIYAYHIVPFVIKRQFKSIK